MQEVLVFGSNGNGQLGIGHQDDVSSIEQCFQTERTIKDIANGSNHTMILLDNGDVFASGVKKAYFNVTVDFTNQFEKVDTGVKLIGTGWDFSVVINDNDEVIMRNSKGVINFGKLIVDETDSIVSLRCSLNAVIVIYQSHRAFCWGDNKKGQLTGDCQGSKIINEFQELKFDDIRDSHELQLIDVSMARYFNVFTMRNLRTNKLVIVMRCKADNYNMVSDLKTYFNCDLIGEISVNRSLVFCVDKHVEVDYIKTMWSSIHAMVKGEIKSTGSNVYGQLLQSSQLKDVELAYFNTGTEHGVAVDKAMKKVYAWGWGEHGNCGIVKDTEEKGGLNELYLCRQDETVSSIYAGYANTWIVVNKNSCS